MPSDRRSRRSFRAMAACTRVRSPAWEFFVICEETPNLVDCRKCGKKVSRGGVSHPNHWTTTNMIKHLERHHSTEFASFLKTKEEAAVSRAPRRPHKTQLSLEQSFKKEEEEWPRSHVRSVKTDTLIGEMIAMDMEPIAIVTRNGFQHLLRGLCPKYKIPDESTRLLFCF